MGNWSSCCVYMRPAAAKTVPTVAANPGMAATDVTDGERFSAGSDGCCCRSCWCCSSTKDSLSLPPRTVNAFLALRVFAMQLGSRPWTGGGLEVLELRGEKAAALEKPTVTTHTTKYRRDFIFGNTGSLGKGCRGSGGVDTL